MRNLIEMLQVVAAEIHLSESGQSHPASQEEQVILDESGVFEVQVDEFLSNAVQNDAETIAYVTVAEVESSKNRQRLYAAMQQPRKFSKKSFRTSQRVPRSPCPTLSNRGVARNLVPGNNMSVITGDYREVTSVAISRSLSCSRAEFLTPVWGVNPFINHPCSEIIMLISFRPMFLGIWLRFRHLYLFYPHRSYKHSITDDVTN